MNNFQQQQQQFPPQFNFRQPQAQGNVYILNNLNEMDSLPVAAGYTVGLIPQENILLLKYIQNGLPVVSMYDLIYHEKDNLSELAQIKSKIEGIEKILGSLKGGVKDYV